jgi:serine phosphatase RsbU (regulator of sigma subunit)
VLDAIGVLLVEDDDGDALLVKALLEDSRADVRLVRSRTLSGALGALGELGPEIDCVLLDLGLPDVVGLESLARLRAAAPELAVIVLTGLDDEAAGVAAVSAGAQDYLVKGQIDGGLLARAIRYAVGRRQAQDAHERLRIAEIHAHENARLERGLMARPIVADPSVWMASSYRPGRRRSLLGGDFLDVVQTDDGLLHGLIGDVCGHGPDEAALGASLRIAWRALTLAGAGAEVVLRTLQRVIEHERQIPGTFATLCTIEVDLLRGALCIRRAGHPLPVLIDGTSVASLPPGEGGPPIGLTGSAAWGPSWVALPAGWSILLYTDGLVEGRVDDCSDRLGEVGLLGLIAAYVAEHPGWRSDPEALLRGLITSATQLNGEELSDDVALLLVGSRDATAPPHG